MPLRCHYCCPIARFASFQRLWPIFFGRLEKHPPWNSYSTCAVADLNGDGVLDIALACATIHDAPPHPGTIAVYLQDPAHLGTFLRPTDYAVPNDPWV